MPQRSADATWEGDLRSGKGTMRFADYEGPYSFTSRFEEGAGTNPEELVGAALAGCFSMSLSNKLAQAGHTPTRVSTSAAVHLTKQEIGFTITSIDLHVEAEVPGVDDETFQSLAEDAKTTCPVSRALGGVEKTVDAKLIG